MFLNRISIGSIFSSLILMTGLANQSSAAQNVTSGDVPITLSTAASAGSSCSFSF
jgi:hypothetical protein